MRWPQPQRSRNENQANNRAEILVQVLPEHFGVEREVNAPLAVADQLTEGVVQDVFLRPLSTQESNLLTVGDEFGVLPAEVASRSKLLLILPAEHDTSMLEMVQEALNLSK